MTCRRICRALLWQARFGELGPGSAPHLDHLADCRACRDELGLDRALVRQLRTALAQRVEGATPSPQAWEGVLARMGRPEPRPSRLRAWSTTLVARLRFGSAMAGATLAFVLALNVDVVPVRPSDAAADARPQSAPPRPLTLADGFPQAAPSAPYAVSGEEREPPGDSSVVVGTVPEPEQLPLAGAPGVAGDSASADDATASSAAETATTSWEPSIRLVPADAAAIERQSSRESDEEAPEQPEPAATPPTGAPS